MKKRILTVTLASSIAAGMISLMHVGSVCMAQKTLLGGGMTEENSIFLIGVIDNGTICAKNAYQGAEYDNYYIMVIDQAGEPLANAQVAYRLDSGSVRDAETDANGIFTVTGLDAESHKIVVGDAAEVEVNREATADNPVVSVVQTTAQISDDDLVTDGSADRTADEYNAPVYLTTTARGGPDSGGSDDSGSGGSGSGSDGSGAAGSGVPGANSPTTGDFSLAGSIAGVILSGAAMTIVLKRRKRS